MGQCLYKNKLFFIKVREMQTSSSISRYYISIQLAKIKMLDNSSVEEREQNKCFNVTVGYINW